MSKIKIDGEIKPECLPVWSGARIVQKQVERNWFECPVCGTEITKKVYQALIDHMNKHGIAWEKRDNEKREYFSIRLDSQVVCDHCVSTTGVRITNIQFELALVGGDNCPSRGHGCKNCDAYFDCMGAIKE